VGRSEAGEVTLLLRCWSEGDRTALDRLMPLLYRELRRLAARYLRRERGGHTLQTTALVHEAYLRLVGQSHIESRSRAEFFGIAARLMREILVNHAEGRRALKRGGGNQITLDETLALTGQPCVDLLALNRELDKLSRLDQRLGRIVELRFFGGLTVEEVAEVMDISTATVQREWRTARAELHRRLIGQSASST
jgi:RNA polymerase sigma factor (TIGR02999 family)